MLCFQRKLQEDYCAKGIKFYMFCGPRESFLQNTKQSVEMGNKEKRIPDVAIGIDCC